MSNMADSLTIFDDMVRQAKEIYEDDLEEVFIAWTRRYQQDLQKYEEGLKLLKEKQAEKEEIVKEISLQNRVITSTRHLLDDERKQRHKAEAERDQLLRTLGVIRSHIDKDDLKVQNEEAHESLRQLTHMTRERRSRSMGRNLTTISEADSASLSISRDNLSDLDDEDNISCTRSGKVFKRSIDHDVSKSRKRSVEVIGGGNRSIVATTEVIVPNQGPIEARAVITAPRHRRSRSEPTNKVDDHWDSDSTDSSSFSRKRTRAGTVVYPSKSSNRIDTLGTPKLPKINSVNQLRSRQHNFMSRSFLKPEYCGPCEKRIRFGKAALKCMDCRAVCHVECKDNVPLPCVPGSAAPNQKASKRKLVIADYAPACPPMIPALVVHCVKEIEKRGLGEEGIYRKSESSEAISLLKQKFLKGRGVPNLKDIDVHLICGVLKSFLMELSEPLIPNSSWRNFVSAAHQDTALGRDGYFVFEVNDLARPNRDTLAFLMLHFIKVSRSPLCRMSKENLARILGPTILGYSVRNPDDDKILSETPIQAKVMSRMLELEEDFWNDVLNRQEMEHPVTPQLLARNR